MQGIDLGNILNTAEIIKGNRLQNQLSQQTLDANVLAQDQSRQQNALLQAYMSGDDSVLNMLSPENQKVAYDLAQAQQDLYAGQRAIEREEAETSYRGSKAILASENPKAFAMAAYPELIEQLGQGGVNVADMPDDQFLQMVQTIHAEAGIVSGLEDEQSAPLSPEGKLQYDIEQGFLTDEQAAQAEDVETFSSVKENPDGSTTGISSKTGTLKVIPRADDSPQTAAQFDAVNKLITEAKKDKRVDNYITVSSNFDRVDSASPNAAGDLALVFSFMKMLDPGSVVREGEQALARNAAGVPERIRTTYNNVLDGQSLSAEQRRNFKAEAGKVFVASRKTAEKAVAPIINQAKRLNLRSETIEEVVFGLPEEQEDLVVPQYDEGQTATGPNGEKIIFRNGEWQVL